MNYSGLAVVDSRSWRVQSRLSSGAPDTVRCTPDSPVNYSGEAIPETEGGKFGVDLPGAPDSPVRQTRAAFGYPLLSLLNPILGLFIG